MVVPLRTPNFVRPIVGSLSPYLRSTTMAVPPCLLDCYPPERHSDLPRPPFVAPWSRSTFKVMMCRRWDVTNAFGKYKSTEYILSDDQCSARCNISHYFISKFEEGKYTA